jgi:hypothetical protein
MLLILARQRARRQPLEPQIQPIPAPAPEPSPVPPVIYRSGFTGAEEENSAHQEQLHESTVLEKEISSRPRERAKTRMVAFFDPALGQQVSLEATAGPLAGKSFPVASNFSVGAIEGNQLTIPDDPTLSSFHARILLSDSVLMIEDLGSTNGTFVNGVRLEQNRKLLKPGDEIRMGRSIFCVRCGGQR